MMAYNRAAHMREVAHDRWLRDRAYIDRRIAEIEARKERLTDDQRETLRVLAASNTEQPARLS